MKKYSMIFLIVLLLSSSAFAAGNIILVLPDGGGVISLPEGDVGHATQAGVFGHNSDGPFAAHHGYNPKYAHLLGNLIGNRGGMPFNMSCGCGGVPARPWAKKLGKDVASVGNGIILHTRDLFNSDTGERMVELSGTEEVDGWRGDTYERDVPIKDTYVISDPDGNIRPLKDPSTLANHNVIFTGPDGVVIGSAQTPDRGPYTNAVQMDDHERRDGRKGHWFNWIPKIGMGDILCEMFERHAKEAGVPGIGDGISYITPDWIENGIQNAGEAFPPLTWPGRIIDAVVDIPFDYLEEHPAAPDDPTFIYGGGP